MIFVDEIDSVLSLNFNIDDFFAVIRDCYNQRASKPDYRRLTFALIGVATPSDLIADKRRTPFNIGRAIELTGFELQEARPLAFGLAQKVSNSQEVLKEILAWTGGQPFLTQKVCQLALIQAEIDPPQPPLTRGEKSRIAEWVGSLVQKRVIENWETLDEPEHLKTIRDRILFNEKRASRLLGLYQQVLIPPPAPPYKSYALVASFLTNSGLRGTVEIGETSSKVWAMSCSRRRPCQIVFTLGSPSCLRPKNKPSWALQRTQVCKLGGIGGGCGVL